MLERLNIKDFLKSKQNIILQEYYKLKMFKDGFVLVGHKGNLYYGVSKDDIWQFYYVYGLNMIPIETAVGRLKAKFTYSILLRND